VIHRRNVLKSVTALALAAHPLSKGYAMTQTSKSWPLIIAHRGASGYLPEHSLEGYRLAAEMGADFIEPDLVFSKDGHLVVRHDHYLSPSTDVAERPEFASRKTTKPGHEGPDWFTEDFTLDELKSLRIKQAFPGRSTAFDGKYQIATFDEVLDLRDRLSKDLGREVGIYPETKVPGYFQSIGLDYLESLLAILKEREFESADSPIIIQSFEGDILKRLRKQVDVRLMHLFDDDAILDETTLKNVAKFANGIGPFKGLLVNKDLSSSGVIEQAHDLGLFVHPWTFRDDQLPPGITTAQQEYHFFFELGVDAVFTDFTDSAYKARFIRHALGD
jgi:glycerophosphoryl diester phosphodiesterase